MGNSVKKSINLIGVASFVGRKRLTAQKARSRKSKVSSSKARGTSRVSR